MKSKDKKYTINSFISGSRLVQMLPPNSYSIASQTVDIHVGSWGVIFLTMQYHIKFPRYLPNKLKELKKWPQGKLLILVVVQKQEEKGKFAQVQEQGLKSNVNIMPCFSMEQARQCLQDISNLN